MLLRSWAHQTPQCMHKIISVQISRLCLILVLSEPTLLPMKLRTGQALKSKAAPAKVIPILSGKIWKIMQKRSKECQESRDISRWTAAKLMLRQNWWKCMMLHQPLQCCHGSLLGTICSWIHSVFLVLSALWPAWQEILSAGAIHQTDPNDKTLQNSSCTNQNALNVSLSCPGSGWEAANNWSPPPMMIIETY